MIKITYQNCQIHLNLNYYHQIHHHYHQNHLNCYSNQIHHCYHQILLHLNKIKNQQQNKKTQKQHKHVCVNKKKQSISLFFFFLLWCKDIQKQKIQQKIQKAVKNNPKTIQKQCKINANDKENELVISKKLCQTTVKLFQHVLPNDPKPAYEYHYTIISIICVYDSMHPSMYVCKKIEWNVQ